MILFPSSLPAPIPSVPPRCQSSPSQIILLFHELCVLLPNPTPPLILCFYRLVLLPRFLESTYICLCMLMHIL